MSIRQPTVGGIGFSKLIDAMICHRVRDHVKVAARWVTVHRHRELMRVRRRAHTKVVTVTHCHPRIVRRKITFWTTMTRHGKRVRVAHRRTIRVVLLPHVVTRSAKRIAHGKATTVTGWLGTPNGTALSGQTIRVLTAPDNGQGKFSRLLLGRGCSHPTNEGGALPRLIRKRQQASGRLRCCSPI